MQLIVRISVIPGDAGYRPHYIPNAKIFVDGVYVRYCHTVDTDLGEARCYSEPLRANSAGTRAEDVVLRGNIKIEFDGGANG